MRRGVTFVETGHEDILLGRDRLGKVPREINIKAVEDCQVVAEELERDNVEDTLETIDSSRYDNCLVLSTLVLVHAVLDSRVVLAADDDGSAFSGRDLGEGILDLGVERVTGHDNDDRHILINQRQRSVLELASENTFRVHVGDFLNLEGALEASRVLVSSTHDKQAAGYLERGTSHLLKGLVIVQNVCNLLRERVKTSDDGVAALSEGDTVLGELKSHHDEGDVLRSVCLCTSDTDFGTSIDVNTTVSLSADCATDNVDHSDAKRSTLQAVAQCENGIGRLTTLAKEDANIVTEDGRLAVQKVTREFDRGRNLCKFFEDGTGGNARVVTGTTRNEDDATTATDDGEVRL